MHCVSTNNNDNKNNKMRKIGLAISLSVLFFLLQSCNNAAREGNSEQEVDNDFLGWWWSVDNRVYPFAATLFIGSDYNFRYYGGACMAHFFSDGYWEINNDTLILNSIKPKGCFYLERFGTLITRIRDEDGRPMTTMGDCTPRWWDFQFVVFENEKFIIEDSILVHIRKQHHCIDERNDFTREWNYFGGIRIEKWYNWEKWINQIDEEKWCQIDEEKYEQLWEQLWTNQPH